MSKENIFIAIVILFVATTIVDLSNSHSGDKIIGRLNQRCEQDSLDAPQAKSRNLWMKSCVKKSVDKVWFDLTVPDIDDNLYYYSFAAKKVVERPRPFYYLFTTNDVNQVWKAPPIQLKACNKVPPGYSPKHTCKSSCYTPTQEVLFSSGYVPIIEAYNEKFEDVMILSPESVMSQINFVKGFVPASGYSSSISERAVQSIIKLTVANGNAIEVTLNHPLISGEGILREANDYEVGDYLVSDRGVKVEIVDREVSQYSGRVYNLSPGLSLVEGVDRLYTNGQILAAQGFLVGSDYYQNDGFNYIGAVILRSQISDEVVEIN